MRLRTLKTKFVIYVIFLIFFISFSFLIFFLFKTNDLIKKDLIDLGFRLAKDLASSSELAVASEDKIFLAPHLKRIFEEKDVVLIVVYNKEGNILASQKKVEIKESILKDIKEELEREKKVLRRINYTQKGEEIYDFYSPIFIGEILVPTLETEEAKELAGFARVGLSLDKIKVQNRAILFIGSIITALIILLGFILAVFLAGKTTKPIKELTKGAEIIGKGNLDYQIKVKTGDEIEALAESFNRMTEDLKKSRASLEEAKTSLEIKVKERTQQLKTLMESLEGKVKERTKELQLKIDELEKFQRLTIGREVVMVELKKEIKILKEKLEKYTPST